MILNLMRLTAVALLVGLLTLMIGPFGAVEAGSGVSDKVGHFVAFGLFLWSFGVLFPRMPRLVAAVSVIALGAAVEVVQGFVGRDASWGDLIADAVGVAVALGLWVLWRGFEPRKAFQTSNTR